MTDESSPRRSDNQRDDEVPRRPLKRPYVTPTLTAYGTLARLTRHGQGSGADGGAVMSMMCL